VGSAVNAPTSSANAWLRRSRRRWTQSRALCCRRRGPPRKLARPPLGSGRRPRTFGVPDLRRAARRVRGTRPRIGRPYRRDPGTRRHPTCPGTAAHPGTTTGSLALRGTGRVPARRSWWRLPAGVVDELGHAVRSATHHPVAILASAATRRSARRRRRHQPLCWAQLGCCGGVHGLDIRSCLAVREWMKGCLMAGKRSLEG